MEFFGLSITTTDDFLNITLAIGFIFLTLALLLVLGRMYKILGKVQGITENVEEIVEIVNHYLWQPARLIKALVEKVKKFFSRKK